MSTLSLWVRIAIYLYSITRADSKIDHLSQEREKSINEIFTIQFHQSKINVPGNNYLYFYTSIIWEVCEGDFKKVIPSEKGKDSK